MSTDLYYTAPEESQFKELKQKAIELWSTKGVTPDYAREKIDTIKDMKNIRDNFMWMVAMFSVDNLEILASMLSEETKKAIKDRIISGGSPEYVFFE